MGIDGTTLCDAGRLALPDGSPWKAARDTAITREVTAAAKADRILNHPLRRQNRSSNLVRNVQGRSRPSVGGTGPRARRPSFGRVAPGNRRRGDRPRDSLRRDARRAVHRPRVVGLSSTVPATAAKRDGAPPHLARDRAVGARCLSGPNPAELRSPHLSVARMGAPAEGCPHVFGPCAHA